MVVTPRSLPRNVRKMAKTALPALAKESFCMYTLYQERDLAGFFQKIVSASQMNLGGPF